jgi:enterochelin esterase-like enzyme
MKINMIWVIFLMPMLLSAQSGKVFDQLTLPSKILKMERKYGIYLPPGYDSSKRDYPVLYLLHGMSDDQTGWIQFGEVLQITDAAIRAGTATPMIIIMPDADTEVIGYVDRPNGEWSYEQFFFEEFMPHVEATYRIKKHKRYRAIAGLSMGGGGSFYYALHRPDLFQSACPLSAYCGPLTVEEAHKHYEWNGLSEVSEKYYEDFYNKYSVVHLMNTLSKADIQSVRWYIDCGDDDYLFEGSSRVHIAMKNRGIPHEYRVRDGAHNWTYWREALPSVLTFVSQGFHQY